MKQWYCHVGGRQYGPVSWETLTEWVRQGRVTAVDHVWTEGMADWVPAVTVPGLLPGAQTASPPSGPAAPSIPGPGPWPGASPTGVGPVAPQPSVPHPAPAVVFQAQAWPTRYVQPHRGSTILTLGILSFCFNCFIFGIVAWSMGSRDLTEMRAGRMDRSGEGLTKAGKLCGMIHVIICIVLVPIWAIWFVLAVVSDM